MTNEPPNPASDEPQQEGSPPGPGQEPPAPGPQQPSPPEYPGQQPPPGGYPQQQPPPGGYPQQPPQPGYPGQQPPPGGYPQQPPQPGYPMQQPPPGGYPPQQPPAKNNSGCIKIGLIVLAVLAILGLIGGGCLVFGLNRAVDEIETQTGKADPSDYELTGPECSNDEFAGPTANGTLKNTSGESQAFEVSVRFTDADGNLITEDTTFTDSIDADQTANWEVTTFETAEGDISCEVSEVNYSLFDG